MPAQSPQDLLTEELKAIHSAEIQVSEALQRLVQEVSNQRLRQSLERRLQQGEKLLQELEPALEELGGAKGEKNEAAAGLIRLSERMLRELKSPEMRDAAAIGNVQKIQHYCIAAWGTAKAFGEALGQKEVVRAMERALQEGKRLDEELTALAEREVNPAMLEAEGSGEAEQEVEGEAEGQGRGGSGAGRSGGGGESDADLKAREYRGPDGQIHHHTHEYMQRHGGEAGKR